MNRPPEYVPAPVPVRPEIEWVDAAAQAISYALRPRLADVPVFDPVRAREAAEAVLDAVAPLIAAEAAAHERAKIVEWLRSEIGRAKPLGREDDATLIAMADDSLRVVANRIESLPAPGTEETI